jgi:hypothetical protein
MARAQSAHNRFFNPAEPAGSTARQRTFADRRHASIQRQLAYDEVLVELVALDLFAGEGFPPLPAAVPEKPRGRLPM